MSFDWTMSNASSNRPSAIALAACFSRRISTVILPAFTGTTFEDISAYFTKFRFSFPVFAQVVASEWRYLPVLSVDLCSGNNRPPVSINLLRRLHRQELPG